MMMFEHSEERRILQSTLRRFLAEPSSDLWKGLAELGVIGALFSEDHGGFGGHGSDLAVVFEEVGRADLTLPLIDNALVPGRLMIAAGGSIENLIAGSERLAFAHAEVAARYDLNWVETRANGNILNGEKTVVVGCESAKALIVSARHSGEPHDEDGIGLWMVEIDAPGLTLQSYDMIQGGRASEVSLNDTPGTLLFFEAYNAISEATAAGTLALAAEMLGAMETSLDMTREYLSTRKQFGRVIGSFQALSHRLVDLMVEIEQARSAVILGSTHLADPAHERDRVLAATKNILGRVGSLVAQDTIQMHGGIGMTQEYDLGRFAKRITMADHRFGDVDHHLERFIVLSS